MPYMVDQAAAGLFADDMFGFSASRLVSYGVKQATVSDNLDCAVTMDGVPGGPWCVRPSQLKRPAFIWRVNAHERKCLRNEWLRYVT